METRYECIAMQYNDKIGLSAILRAHYFARSTYVLQSIQNFEQRP